MSGEFTFDTTPRIHCRDGAASTLGQLARDCGMTNALIVTDRGVLQSGIADDALASFHAAGLAHCVSADVLPDPPERSVLDAV